MAYQKVGTPRFYIDYLSYLETIGMVNGQITGNHTNIEGKFYGLDPVSVCKIEHTNPNSSFKPCIDFNDYLGRGLLKSVNYYGVLGHTFNDLPDEYEDLTATQTAAGYDYYNWAKLALHPVFYRINPEGDLTPGSDDNESLVGALSCAEWDVGNERFILNADECPHGQEFICKRGGASLVKAIYDPINSDEVEEDEIYDIDRVRLRAFTYATQGGGASYDYEPNQSNITSNFTGEWHVGSFVFGHYYDMPYSPDLQLNMEVEFDGYDSFETMGGSTMTRINYHGAPLWQGKYNPWQSGEGSPNYGHPEDDKTYSEFITRNGRRVWNLKFSYMSQGDVFSSNYMWNESRETTSGFDESDLVKTQWGKHVPLYTLADDESFSAKVLNFIGNGQKFIFQSDNTSNNPSDFAICQLDQSSLKIDQVANGVYSFSLKIREVW